MLLGGCGEEGGNLNRASQYAFSKGVHGGHGGREWEPSAYHQPAAQHGEGETTAFALGVGVE